ncbi:unnamed protein product [Lampetra fluviatilis]
MLLLRVRRDVSPLNASSSHARSLAPLSALKFPLLLPRPPPQYGEVTRAVKATAALQKQSGSRVAAAAAAATTGTATGAPPVPNLHSCEQHAADDDDDAAAAADAA